MVIILGIPLLVGIFIYTLPNYLISAIRPIEPNGSRVSRGALKDQARRHDH